MCYIASNIHVKDIVCSVRLQDLLLGGQVMTNRGRCLIRCYITYHALPNYKGCVHHYSQQVK